MKNLLNITFSFVTAALLNSCLLGSGEEPVPMKENEISFNIEKTNSQANFKASAVSSSLVKKLSGWQLNNDSTIDLTREAQYKIFLDNGDTINFSIWLMKRNENSTLLNLEDEELHYWKRNWDYKNFDDEVNNLYHDFDEARLIINQGHVIFHEKENELFDILNVQEVIVGSKAKSYITINFSGRALGFYDPTGENLANYILTNGALKGFIE